MTHIDFLYTAVRPKGSEPLSNYFIEFVEKSEHIIIAVGYVSEESLRYLADIISQNSKLSVTLVCGMAATEGLTEIQLRIAREINETLTRAGRGGVYVTPRMKYHGKVYLFQGEGFSSCYVGSGNLSSIVPNYRDTFEAGVVLTETPEKIYEHLSKDVLSKQKPIDLAHVPIINDERSEMHAVVEAQAVSTQQVVRIMNSPSTYEFKVPLKAEKLSSLNAHLGGGGGRVRGTGGKRPRSWYEGELIVGKAVRAGVGYPSPGVPFTVVTDDGWTFDCMTSGQDGKNLRSVGKLSIFGTWLKSRFIEAGALKFGEPATDESIRKFGRDHLTMKYHPEFDIWTFDLGVI